MLSQSFATFHKYLTERAHVKQDDFEKLIPLFTTKKYKKGQILLAEGDVCQHIFFVEEGLLRFYSIGTNGKENILQFAPENSWLTDRNNLYSDEPSSYFIDSLEETNVVLMDYQFILKAIEISSEFRAFHDKILQRHIRHLYHRVNLLIGATATERYLDFIHAYPNIIQRVPQWMVASYLGITPESLSRVRKELVK